LLVAAGIFGFVVTIGLLFYELRGIQRCIRLAQVGKALEHQVGVDGRFTHWPSSVGRFVNEPLAAALIYSGFLAMWAFLATVTLSPETGVMSSVVVFIVGVAVVWIFYRYVDRRKSATRAIILPARRFGDTVLCRPSTTVLIYSIRPIPFPITWSLLSPIG
jgi:hypothetical protein